jgi:peptidoglycan L-alanyl-D-glutamate endopeptidase CwlK
MVYLISGFVFLGSLALVGWLLFPSAAFTYWDSGVGITKSRCRKVLKIFKSVFFLVTRSLFIYITRAYQSTCFLFGKHRKPLTAGLLVVVLPTILAVLLRGPVVLEGYEERPTDPRAGRSVIASLLQGERLVPPRPLPPGIFLTAEVERVRPLVSAADRSWERLDAEFMQHLLVVYKIMRDRHGYEMALLEGFRSPEKQASLSSTVTNAAPGRSYHQYGLAADSAFVRRGKLVISEKDAWAMRGYELYGQVAEEIGLTWGGRWKLLDYGHVEFRRAGSGPSRGRVNP